MNWIRENKFWSSVSGIALLLIVVVGYVYFTTPLHKERQRVNQLVQMLNAWVDKSEDVSDDKAQIPPKAYKKRLQENEQIYRDDVDQMVRKYLDLGKGIEVWFEGNRSPKTGRFEILYQEHQKKLQKIVNQEFESVEKEEGGIFGGGGRDETQRIDWPENPTANMRRTQKQFWIIKRLVYNAIDADVISLQSLSFEDQDQSSPVQILDRDLANRFLVSMTVTLPPDKIGRLLSKLLEVKPNLDLSNSAVSNDRALNLMMHVTEYRISKKRTTSDTIAELAQTEGETQFIYPLIIKEELSGWQLKDTQLPERLNQPGSVTLRFQVAIHDPHEPTIAWLLQETLGNQDEAVKNAFQPFYTDEEVNRFLNNN